MRHIHIYSRLDISCGAAADALRPSVFSWLADAIAGGLIIFFSVPIEKRLFSTQVRIISTPRAVFVRFYAVIFFFILLELLL